jgi:hypothetical protein
MIRGEDLSTHALRWFGLLMIGWVALALPALGDLIPVANSGFENPAYGDGGYSGGVPGWAIFWPGGSSAGVMNPPTSWITGEAPEGQNVAWVNWTGAGIPNYIEQVLAVTLTPNTSYSLQVLVGSRKDLAFSGYQVLLLAGGVVLSLDDNTLSPVDGFLESTVNYLASGDDPYLGQALAIRLVSSPYGAYWQASFDDVRLQSESAGDGVPEPASLILTTGALLVLAGLRRLRVAL